MPNYTLDIFKTGLVPCSWPTMYVGNNLKLLSYDEISRYAIEYLLQHPNCTNQYIVELAYGLKRDEFDIFLKKILISLNYSLIEKDDPLWNLEKKNGVIVF